MQFPPQLAKQLLEISKQSGADEEEILKRGALFEEFQKSPGWELLKAIALGQQENHITQMFDVNSSRDRDQFIKGLIFGQRLILMTPTLVVEHRKEILEARKKAPASKADEDK